MFVYQVQVESAWIQNEAYLIGNITDRMKENKGNERKENKSIHTQFGSENVNVFRYNCYVIGSSVTTEFPIDAASRPEQIVQCSRKHTSAASNWPSSPEFPYLLVASTTMTDRSPRIQP